MHTVQQVHQSRHAGASELAHFVVKFFVEKAGSEKICMLLTFLCYINFIVLFHQKPQNHLLS